MKFLGTNPVYWGWGCPSKCLHHHGDQQQLPTVYYGELPERGLEISNSWACGLEFQYWPMKMVFSEREKRQLVTCQMTDKIWAKAGCWPMTKERVADRVSWDRLCK